MPLAAQLTESYVNHIRELVSFGKSYFLVGIGFEWKDLIPF